MTKPIYLVFVEEALRLGNEDKLLEAIVSLNNACCCRDLDRSYVKELRRINNMMVRQYQKGRT